MIRFNKAQGLSLNTIIIAALGLVVLIVMIMLFYSKSQDFSAGVSSCASKLGDCVGTEQECTNADGRVVPASCKGSTKGPICCVNPFSKQSSESDTT